MLLKILLHYTTYTMLTDWNIDVSAICDSVKIFWMENNNRCPAEKVFGTLNYLNISIMMIKIYNCILMEC